MIVFYSDSISLDLTEIKLTLIEENPLFFDYGIKNYSWPFNKILDEETSRSLNFLDHENIANYQTKYYGKLLIDNSFEPAYLIIEDYKNNILSGYVYYGSNSFELFDTKLSDLPFPTINTTDLSTHAKDVVTKAYPDVAYNFPMVIDEGLSSKSRYKSFEGIINKYVANQFLANYLDAGTAINRNIVTPFPYLLEILRVGFETEGLKMTGDFVADPTNSKILIKTDLFLEKFYSGINDSFQFTITQETWDNGVLYADFLHLENLSQTGSYKIIINTSFPKGFGIREFKVSYNGEELFSSNSNTINKELVLNVRSTQELDSIRFDLKILKASSNPVNSIGSIANYNLFQFEFTDGQLNEFPNTFSLSQVMPDMTFGSFFNLVKNRFNLEYTYGADYVQINYIENRYKELKFNDETDFEIQYPHIKFNQNKLYNLKFPNEEMYIDKQGEVFSKVGYRPEDIVELNSSFELLPIEAHDGIITSKDKLNTESKIKMLLYNGLQNSEPVAVDKVNGRSLTLKETYDLFWKNWLHFRLNSGRYLDSFIVHSLEKFDITQGRFKYNKKHLYRKIKKTRLSENLWQIEVESESLP